MGLYWRFCQFPRSDGCIEVTRRLSWYRGELKESVICWVLRIGLQCTGRAGSWEMGERGCRESFGCLVELEDTFPSISVLKTCRSDTHFWGCFA